MISNVKMITYTYIQYILIIHTFGGGGARPPSSVKSAICRKFSVFVGILRTIEYTEIQKKLLEAIHRPDHL